MKEIIDILITEFNRMSKREHMIYWVLPILVLGTSMFFYFSEIPPLVNFICPQGNCEWGFLENLQLLIVFGIFILSLLAFFRKKERFLKWLFGLIALFAIFVFLEEIDYGEHFAQLLMGTEGENYEQQLISIRNIHNRGSNAKLFKRSVYLIMAMIFVIAPFFKSRVKNPLVKYFVPGVNIVFVAVLTIISDLLPRLIVILGGNLEGGLGVETGEFSEIMVYYIFFIYLLQLIYVNRFQNNGLDSEPLDANKCR